MRRCLDRKQEQGNDWRAAFLPLLKIPSMDLSEVSSATGALAKSATLVGGIVMTWKMTSAALLAALLVAYAISSTQREPQPALDQMPVEVSDAHGLAPAPGPAQLPAAGEQRQAADTVTHTRQPLALSPMPLEGPTLAVLVTDATGRAIPTARVWIGETSDPIDGVWESGVDGIALIPMPEGKVVCISSSTPELYGNSYVLTEICGGETRVVLFPDADVSVLIVDQAGEPLEGVPVSRDGHLGYKWWTLTDARGIAVLRHVLDAFKFDRDSHEFSVGPAILLLDRPDVMVSRENVPVEPVRIILPSTGSLELRVVDAQGQPNLSAVDVRLVLDPDPGAERNVPELVALSKLAPLGQMEIKLTDGAATLPYIGLGLEFLAESRKAEPTQSTFGFAGGPDKPGACVELRLAPLDVAPQLVGLARSLDGSVLAQRTLKARLSISRGPAWESSRLKVTTDASGQFRLFVNKALSSQWATLSIRTLSLSLEDSGPLDSRLCSPTLPEQLLRGDNDLGTLIFESEVPLVTGHAIDRSGNPVQLDGGLINIRIFSEHGKVRSALGTRHEFSGSAFAFFGTPPELREGVDEGYEVWLWADGRPQCGKQISPADRDVVFVFNEGGTLTGTVQVQPGDSAHHYYAVFYSSDDSGLRRQYGKRQVAQNGRLELDGLPLTSGEVVIGSYGTGAVMARITGVLPDSGSAVQATRLHSIQLGRELNDFTLHVVDEQGQPIDEAYFDPPALPGQMHSPEYNFLSWSADQDTLEGEVTAAGYRTTSVVLVPGEQTLSLHRGPQVILWPSEPTDLPRGASLIVLLVSASGDEQVELKPHPAGGYTGYVSGPGQYHVRGRILQDGVSVAELPFKQSPLASVSVTELEGTQELHVAYDSNSFQQSVPAA